MYDGSYLARWLLFHLEKCSTVTSAVCVGNLECTVIARKPKASALFPQMAHSTPEEEQWHTPEVVGKWCAVLYEGHIYPGIIQEVNETHCQVKCMHRGGKALFLPVEGPLVSLWGHADHHSTTTKCDLTPPGHRRRSMQHSGHPWRVKWNIRRSFSSVLEWMCW